MKITEKQIEEMAKEYAENENSAYTNDYYGFINGFKKALTLYGVSQQRELLRSYNKFVNERCLLAGGVLSEFEIKKFEERNCG